MILFATLLTLAFTALTVSTVVTVHRDGYRATPTDPRLLH